jgi:hypothetical protein
VAAAGLVVARFVVQPVRDAWIFVGAARDGSVVVARYDVSNTGVFADQLTTRLAVLRDGGSPLAHRAISGPARFDDDGVHGALDAVDRRDGEWTWTMGGESLRAFGRTDADATCPPRVGSFTAVVDLADAGGLSGDGRTVAGRGLMVRTHAVGNVAGGALYALDARGALGVDPLARCAGFIVVDGQAEAVEAPWIPPDPDREFSLELGGHHVAVRVEQRPFEEGALDHTLLPERWIAWAVGFRTPTLTLHRVRVRVDGAPAWPGLLMRRTHAPPS